MNFLAHLFLSGDNDDVRIGNFIGDFVKGKQLEDFPEKIRQGIILHRRIDDFTDNHPVVLQSKVRLRPRYRHYAPVIVDMYYDHFLAANWSDYSSVGLKNYTSHFYNVARSKSDLIPKRAVELLYHMSSTDWLYNYQHLEGMRRALDGMARRSRFNSGMDQAIVDLEDNYGKFLSEFRTFFPEVIDFCGHD